MEKKLYTAGIMHCTKADLIEALKDVKDTDMILLSNGEDFFTIREIAYDEQNDVVIRPSKEPY